MQQEAIVHIVSIFNVTRYAAQVNRQHINIIMDTVDRMIHDVNNLYNITTSLSTSLSYYQLVLPIRSVLANLQGSLSYIRTVSMHTMGYFNAATSGTLSPDILPITNLKQMLSHIEETLPHTMHLPASSENTLHFYRYLCTHILIHNRQIFATYRCPYTGSYTTTFNLQNFYLGYSTWKFHSMIRCQYPISWSHTG